MIDGNLLWKYMKGYIMKKLLSLIGLLSICLQESTMQAMESKDAPSQAAPQRLPTPAYTTAPHLAQSLPFTTNSVPVAVIALIIVNQTLACIQNLLCQSPKVSQGASQAVIDMVYMAQKGLAQPTDVSLQDAQVLRVQENKLATLTQALALAQQLIMQEHEPQSSAIQEAQAVLGQAKQIVRTILTPLFPPHVQDTQARQIPQQTRVPAQALQAHQPIAEMAQAQSQSRSITPVIPAASGLPQNQGNTFTQYPILLSSTPFGYRPWHMNRTFLYTSFSTTKAEIMQALSENKFESVLNSLCWLAGAADTNSIKTQEDLNFGKRLLKINPLFFAIEQKNLAFVQFLDPITLWYASGLPTRAWISDLPIPLTKSLVFSELNNRNNLSPLEYAIATDATEIALWMIKKGNTIHLRELRPLIIAAIKLNELTLVEALLEKLHLHPNLPNNLLDFAQTADVANLLIRYGFDKHRAPVFFDYPSRFDVGQKFRHYSRTQPVITINMTPLHTAVSKENLEVVKVLIEAGAQIHAQEFQLDPLHIAAIRGNSAIIDVLIKAGQPKNKKDAYGFTALDYALINDNKDAIEALHKAGHCLTKNTCALQVAVKENRLDLVQFFIDNHVNLNYRGAASFPPMYYAKSVEMLALLVCHGARIDKSIICKYLSYPTPPCCYDMITYILEHGGNISLANQHQETPLYKAIRLEDLKLTKLCLEHRANVNAIIKDRISSLPIIQALKHPGSDSAMLKLLLGHPLLMVPTNLTTLVSPKKIKRIESLVNFAMNWQKYIARKGWMRISKHGETPLLLAAICNKSAALREFFTKQLGHIPARYSTASAQVKGSYFDNQETALFKPQARYYVNAHDKSGLSALMYLARYTHHEHFINSLLPYSVYAVNAGNKLYTEEVLKAAQEAASCGNYRIACALLNACLHDVSSIFFGEEVASTPQIEEVAESEIEEKVAQ